MRSQLDALDPHSPSPLDAHAQPGWGANFHPNSFIYSPPTFTLKFGKA